MNDLDFELRIGAHREWERAMMHAHPCWGTNCISCGCTVEEPCISHYDGSGPRGTDITRERARKAEQYFRAQLWPDE